MPQALFEAASRASPLPRKPGSARVCRELLWERPLAAIRLMPAAGFVRGCIAGKPASRKPAAPFAIGASFCGSGLWPRCGACGPQASFEAVSRASPLPGNPRLRSRSGRAFVGAASGRDAARAGRRLRSRLYHGQARFQETRGSVRDRGELLWERPLAAIRRMRAAGFVRGCIAGKPAPTKPRLRSCLSRAVVGAASGRDAARAGRGLRSKLYRGQARSHQTPPPLVFVASWCGSGLWPRCGACGPQASFEAASRASPLPPNPGSVRDRGELLWERPLAAIRRMRAAGFVQGCIAGKPAPSKTLAPFMAHRAGKSFYSSTTFTFT